MGDGRSDSRTDMGQQAGMCGQWDRAVGRPVWTGQASECGVGGWVKRRLSEAGTPGGTGTDSRAETGLWTGRLGWRDARGKKGNLAGAGAQWRGI